jgi:hypothetical protein
MLNSTDVWHNALSDAMVDINYCAIPSSSKLYSRLQSKKPLNIMLVDVLFPLVAPFFAFLKKLTLDKLMKLLKI